MTLIRCVCDGCGKRARCRADEPAPRGWFYFKVYANPDDDADCEQATALTCSTDCQRKIPWKKSLGGGA